MYQGPASCQRRSQRRKRQLPSRQLLDTADEPEAEQRMAPKIEEALVDRDRRPVGDLLPDRHQTVLERVARRAAVGSVAPFRRELEARQGRTGRLARRSSRQTLERDEARGDHVTRQPRR